MTNKFTQKAQNTLNRALHYAREMGHTYIGSEHLLLGLLCEKDSIASRILLNRGADAEKLRKSITDLAGSGSRSDVTPSDMTPRVKKIIEASAAESVRCGNHYIGTEHLLSALIGERDCVAVRLLEAAGIPTSELKADLSAFLGSAPERRNSSKDTEEKLKIRGAPTLSSYGRDLTDAAREGKIDPIIGRENETERVIRILSRRTKNNPCLIGEPGVGKTAVVEGLAQRIADENVPETLVGKRVITLDIPSMIAGAKYRGEFEERMKNVMEEVMKNPGIILFIDEIHMIIGAGAAEGAVDAANIIKPALARGELQMIGATTVAEYRAHIEKDAALERRFQSVMVGEPTPAEAEQILIGLRDRYEAHHRLKITDEAIHAAVSLSVRYIPDRYLPDKAIDLVDEAAAKVRIHAHTPPPEIRKSEEELKRLAKDKEEAILGQDFESAAALRDRERTLNHRLAEFRKTMEAQNDGEGLKVTAADIAEIITGWTGIPAGDGNERDDRKLLNLEEELKKRVVGQDEAIAALTKAIHRSRAGFRNPMRPIGSFIFLGQTGVGKTELCKALGECMFGRQGTLIRLDMSEYMEKHSVSRLIGSPPGYVGYGEGGQLTEKVRRHPYSVLLFDEIEKAHPDIFNLLLQILEDGTLTDSQGRRVDFRNTVVIMTSNIGANELRTTHTLGFSDRAAAEEGVREKMMQALREKFRPEFLNRIDEILIFHPLSRDSLRKIAEMMLGEVAERAEGAGISLHFDAPAIDLLVQNGYQETYGARPLRRTVVRMVEDRLAAGLLEGKFSVGDSVDITAEGNDLVFRKHSEVQG